MKVIKNALQNVLLVIFSFVFCLIVAEYAAYLLFPRVVSENGKNILYSLMYRQSFQATGNFENDGTPISEIEILPYYLYRNKPNSSIDYVQQINNEGYRNGAKEFLSSDKSDVIRILAIGGSTTFGWLIKNYQDAWPHQLEQILNEKYDATFEVINAGLPGGTSAESLIGFLLKDKYLKPDIVLFHNGGNDAAPLLLKEYYADYRYYKTVSGGPELRPGENQLLHHSNLAKLLYALWLEKAALSKIVPKDIFSVRIDEAFENAKKNEPTGFERNMETLIHECLLINAKPILFPFHLADERVYTNIPKSMSYAQKFHPVLSYAQNKNKDVLKALALKHKVDYLEMPPDQIPLDYFFDHCHLKPKGDKIKAEFLAENLNQTIKKIMVSKKQKE